MSHPFLFAAGLVMTAVALLFAWSSRRWKSSVCRLASAAERLRVAQDPASLSLLQSTVAAMLGVDPKKVKVRLRHAIGQKNGYTGIVVLLQGEEARRVDRAILSRLAADVALFTPARYRHDFTLDPNGMVERMLTGGARTRGPEEPEDKG